MPYLMRIEGLVSGGLTAFDGQYLKDYDPNRDGREPLTGSPMMAHIVTTTDAEEALRFPSLEEIHATWAQIDDRNPVRPDGKPNRPLTAFTISTVQVP